MDIIWHPDTAVDSIVWPQCEGPINGFTDKTELLSKLQNPMEDLSAIIFVTENYMTQNYHPEDIVAFELQNPNWTFDDEPQKSALEHILNCAVGAGTTIRISPDADEWDRFGLGHSDFYDAKKDAYILTLFERNIALQDIVYIKLIYDSDYWEWFENKDPYERIINSEYPKKYLQFAVPWHLDECKVPIDYSDYGIDDNPFQKSYLEETGTLNIVWRCPNLENGICNCK